MTLLLKYFLIFSCARKNHTFCKRTQIAETFRLLGKGVNARDFNTFPQKQKPRFLLLHLALYGKREGRG